MTPNTRNTFFDLQSYRTTCIFLWKIYFPENRAYWKKRFSLISQFLLYGLQSFATIGENLPSILSKTGNKGGLQLAREVQGNLTSKIINSSVRPLTVLYPLSQKIRLGCLLTLVNNFYDRPNEMCVGTSRKE